MDLIAYENAKTNVLKNIAKENNIEVPRLRGYRLMEYEEAISSEEIKKIMDTCEFETCANLCYTKPFWNGNSCCFSYDPYTHRLCKYYLVEDTDKNGYIKYTDIRWDRIHGWKRKVLKFEIKKQKRRVQKQIDMWNKYAGKKNVLYIHARIGGGNWSHYGGNELVKMPWFLDKVDDYFDGTYCDIYAAIK